MSKAPSCLAELYHISKNKHHRPYPQNDPRDPALHLSISCHDALPCVLNQHKLFDEIVHPTCNHHCTNQGCCHDKESLLPSECQKTEDQTQANQNSKWYPPYCHMVECLDYEENRNADEKAKTKSSKE